MARAYAPPLCRDPRPRAPHKREPSSCVRTGHGHRHGDGSELHHTACLPCGQVTGIAHELLEMLLDSQATLDDAAELIVHHRLCDEVCETARKLLDSRATVDDPTELIVHYDWCDEVCKWPQTRFELQ